MTHSRVEYADDRQSRGSVQSSENRSMDPRRAAARRAAGLTNPNVDTSALPQVKQRHADEAKRKRQLADLEAAKKRLKK